MRQLNPDNIDTIALHHMASPADVKGIECVHVNSNNWGAIGYSYYIGYDGKVYEGRGLKFVAAGVANHNSHVLSIGFQGNYHPSSTVKVDRIMPLAQFNAGVELICELLYDMPNIKSLVGHKHFGGSVCPGNYFPLEKMIKEANALLDRIKNLERKVEKLEKNQEPEYNWTMACPEWSRPYVQKALDLGLIKGDENGQLGLTDTKIHSLILMLRAHKIME